MKRKGRRPESGARLCQLDGWQWWCHLQTEGPGEWGKQGLGTRSRTCDAYKTAKWTWVSNQTRNQVKKADHIRSHLRTVGNWRDERKQKISRGDDVNKIGLKPNEKIPRTQMFKGKRCLQRRWRMRTWRWSLPKAKLSVRRRVGQWWEEGRGLLTRTWETW